MESLSLTTLLFITGEVLVMVAIVAVIFYKKNVILKKNLLEQIKNLLTARKDLKKERSQEAIRDKIQQYLEDQKTITVKRCDAARTEDQSEQRVALLEMRQFILDSELKTLKKVDLDVGFWDDIYQRYETIRPEPEVITITETIEVPAPEREATKDGDEHSGLALGDNVFSTAADELTRLNSVISNQYASIDELYKQMRGIESEDPDFSNSPFVIELKARLEAMEGDQNQMATCVKVIESENDRLLDIIKQYENDRDGQDDGDTDTKMDEDGVTDGSIEEKLQIAEKLVKNLTQTNKEHLQCITILEGELALYHAAEGDVGGQSEVSFEQAKAADEHTDRESQEQKETQALVKSLIKTNKEQLGCIAILESEVDALAKAVSEKEALLAQFESDTGILSYDVATSDNNSDTSEIVTDEKLMEVTGKLNAKIAELGLLQSDYDSMKQKYIELFQQSRAS